MKVKKIVAVLMTATLLVTTVPLTGAPVEALTLEEAAAQRAELQQQLININRELAEVQDEVEKAEAKAASYAERVAIVQEQIDLLKQSIALKEEELAARQEELELKIIEIEQTYELFKERMRALYMSNNESMTLEMLLGSSSFTEFVMNTEASRRISEHDTELIELLEQEQREIEEHKRQIEADLESLEADKAELDAKYNELAILYQEANNELSAAEALQDATQEDYDRILSELEAVNAQWDALMGTGMQDYIGNYFAWPVPGFNWVSSGFGWRKLYGRDNFHGGIDIAGAGIYGAPIIASDTGQVRTSGYNAGGYGNYVIIDHGGNNWTVYGHMTQRAVYAGQWVAQGEVIGYVGSTGNSTGPHLHFEIRLNGQKMNPLDYVVR